jgi:DNA-binding GntR family transcriptional regulator
LIRKRPQTARHYVLSVMRSEILDGRHGPGSRLRQEEVALRLGVSTTPVREAFRDLLSEGLVGEDAHRGVVVRGLTLFDAREVFEMRMALEPMLAVQALRNAKKADLDEAAKLHDLLCGERDPAKWSELNFLFHDRLHAPAGEGRLSTTVLSLGRAAGAYVNLSMHFLPQLMDANNRDHVELLKAYRELDELAVQAVTRRHVEQTLRAIEKDTVLIGLVAAAGK